MKKHIVFLSVLLLSFLLAVRTVLYKKEEKFSVAKKYAIIPFNCADKDLAINVPLALKEWLEKYDYNHN